MKEKLTIEKVNFNIRTQALLNFTPISFVFKHKDKIKHETFEKQVFDEDVHRTLGNNFITFVDKDNVIWEMKIVKFPKEYDRLISTLEASPHIIPYQFNIIDAGLVGVSFLDVIKWAHGKYIMPRKMSERSPH